VQSHTHLSTLSVLEGQPWSRAVKSFFISTQHQRVPGGIEVQANNVLKVLNKMCIAGMFERLYYAA